MQFIEAMFIASLTVGIVRYALSHPTRKSQPPQAECIDEEGDVGLNLRTCGECYTTVSGPTVYTRCPECGAPLDVRLVS